jgi:hypothetical protein
MDLLAPMNQPVVGAWRTALSSVFLLYASVCRCSAVGQKATDFPHIASFDQLRLKQMAFALRGLFRQNMAMMRLVVRVFSAAGPSKPLGSGTVCFDLGHVAFSLRVI